MMIQAVLGNPHHPEYGVATIPFPIPRDQYAHCMELLEAGKKLRSYITKGNSVTPDKFIGMFFGGQPITAEEFDALTALRMENTGKVRGVFDVNFDKREFSAVNIMDGWQTWAMHDVSVAVYHATRSRFAPDDDRWRKLLDHLSGKEICQSGGR